MPLYNPPAAGGGASLITTKKLSADLSNSTTTFAKVTNLDQVVGVGTWAFQYFIRHQAAATTTGIKFTVNHSGTVTSFMATSRKLEATTAASTGAQSQVFATFGLISGGGIRAKSTTAPLGVSISHDAANADTMTVIEGLMVVTVSGNLELYHASEVAAASTVKADSMLILTGPSS